MVNILKLLPNQISLYETVITTANDYLVNLFLKNKIKYDQIQKLLFKFIKNKKLTKYKKIKAKNIDDIIFVKNIVSSNINNF